MLLQSLRAVCYAPWGRANIWKFSEALVRATIVSERFACGFWTDLGCAIELRYIRFPTLLLCMFIFEILLLIKIQSLLWIHCLPMDLLSHYRILQV
jgi:hypothetical protein